MLLDQQSGFGAVAEELLHAISDDFGRLPTVLFSLAPAATPPRPSAQASSLTEVCMLHNTSVCREAAFALKEALLTANATLLVLRPMLLNLTP